MAFGRRTLVTILAAAAVVVLLVSWSAVDDLATSPVAGAPDAREDSATGSPSSVAPPAAVPSTPSTTAPAAPAAAAPSPSRPAEDGARQAAKADPPQIAPQVAGVTVLTAAVCSDLVRRGAPDWDCTRVDGSSPPRMLTFYTRVAADQPTTIEHRWYYDGRLHQTMKLRLPASGASGYRTFSRNTVSGERKGDWKVEVRTADGTLLQEERFVIR